MSNFGSWLMVVYSGTLPRKTRHGAVSAQHVRPSLANMSRVGAPVAESVWHAKISAIGQIFGSAGGRVPSGPVDARRGNPGAPRCAPAVATRRHSPTERSATTRAHGMPYTWYPTAVGLAGRSDHEMAHWSRIGGRTRVRAAPRAPTRAPALENIHGKRHARHGVHRAHTTPATPTHACQRGWWSVLTTWGVVCTRFARGALQPFYARADGHVPPCERAATLGWDWSGSGIAT